MELIDWIERIDKGKFKEVFVSKYIIPKVQWL